jgi:hypothetical protein
MALKMSYDPDKLRQDAERIERAIISRMEYIGEQFITEAKSQPQPTVSRKKKGKSAAQGPKEPFYEDQTGNLRSSVGYYILRDNEVVSSKVEGTGKAIEAAKLTVESVPERPGIRLVGVAGMDYALFVESKGYNVITTQSIVAIDNLDKQLKELSHKTGKKTELLTEGISKPLKGE